MAFGERKAMENSIERYNTLSEGKSKKLVEQMFRLYGTDVILKDLAFFLGEEVIRPDQVKNAKLVHTGLIKEIALEVDFILENMNVPT